MYIVINVCFLVVVFYPKKGGGVLQKSIFILNTFLFCVFIIARKGVLFQKK